MSILSELAELESLAGLPDAARRIRGARLAAGIPQSTLSRELHLTHSYVNHVEAGRANVSERQVQRFLAAIQALAEDAE